MSCFHHCLACTGEHSHDNVPVKVGLSSPVKKIVQLGLSFNQHKAHAILAKLRRDNEDATKRGDSDALISLPKVNKYLLYCLTYSNLFLYLFALPSPRKDRSTITFNITDRNWGCPLVSRQLLLTYRLGIQRTARNILKQQVVQYFAIPYRTYSATTTISILASSHITNRFSATRHGVFYILPRQQYY